MTNICIDIKEVSKSFRVPLAQKREFREHIIQILKGSSSRKFLALENVNLQIRQGEFVSIIGRNGCGKSTLLKVIAGIYAPTKGFVNVRGAISSFLELGVGFNNELSALENIHLYGAIMGLTKRQIKEKIDEVLRFADLEAFKNARLQTFSSGMQVRLAFSVAIQAYTPILLVDEVLAVGDADFRKKCFAKFENMKKEGRTIVYVSHDMDSVLKFSDRVVHIKDGKIISAGDPKVMVEEYLNETEKN